MVIDVQDFMAAITKSARDGVEASLLSIQERARKKAPVRRIFMEDSRRRAMDKPIGVGDLSLNESQGVAFEHPAHTGRLVFQTFAGSSNFAVSGTRGSRGTQGVVEGSFGRKTKMETQSLVRGGTVQGRVNSQDPVIKTNTLGRVGGNLRQYGPTGGLAISRIYGSRKGLITVEHLSDYLSTRGRYEVASGRSATMHEGRKQVGGRLRDGITVSGPFVEEGEIFGFVEAYAADPGRDFNYAWAQEVGTGHNRPQPFLRPALREEAQSIASSQRSKLASALRTYKPRDRGRPVGGITIALKLDWRGRFSGGGE